MPFSPLYYDIISLKSLRIIQVFHLLHGFAGNQGVFWDFKIQNSVRITEGSDNGDSDNRGSTAYTYIYIYIYICIYVCMYMVVISAETITYPCQKRPR